MKKNLDALLSGLQHLAKSPPDFFLWVFLKNKVYTSKPHDTGDLMSRITAVIREVLVDLCQKVCRSVAFRLRECKDNEGAQVFYLLCRLYKLINVLYLALIITFVSLIIFDK